jgi:hypothetical protein
MSSVGLQFDDREPFRARSGEHINYGACTVRVKASDVTVGIWHSLTDCRTRTRRVSVTCDHGHDFPVDVSPISVRAMWDNEPIRLY